MIKLSGNGSTTSLACPICGEDGGLHHGRIVVFDRAEDDPHILRTIVDDEAVQTAVVTNKDSGNPSLRRHGMTVDFSCEFGHEWVLTIAQHKGQTFFGWQRR